MTENRIRMTRAAPPGRGAEDERRPTYLAAIQQYEELMRAAAGTPYAARPLPLFYALSQGGRAVLAAHGGSEWTARGHGLAEDVISEPIVEATIRPAPAKRDLYGLVSDVVGSPRLQTSVELGALWSELPDLFDTPLPDQRWPRPIRVVPAIYSQRELVIGAASRAALVFPSGMTPSKDELGQLLMHYPGAEDLAFATAPGVPGLLTETTTLGSGVLVGWRADNEEDEPPQAVDVAPEHRFVGAHWLIPRVGGVAVTPLMTWWVLLFGLSLLARYEPAAWVAALDANTSLLAVPLEDALDVALEAVPHLLLEALLGEQVLLHQ